MAHKERSPLAGQTVRLKSTATHPQVPDFGGSEYHVEDWWDRVGGQSWMFSRGNPACLVYSMRLLSNPDVPKDDEVLYGKVGHFGHLVHVSEIEPCTERAHDEARERETGATAPVST